MCLPGSQEGDNILETIFIFVDNGTKASSGVGVEKSRPMPTIDASLNRVPDAQSVVSRVVDETTICFKLEPAPVLVLSH